MSANAISHNTRLAPDALGPTVTIGEILVEIMAKSRGNGFLEPIELDRPISERCAGDLHRPVRKDRRFGGDGRLRRQR